MRFINTTTPVGLRFVDTFVIDPLGGSTEKDSMGVLWPVGIVITAGAAAIALGLNIILSLCLAIVALGLLIRREIIESLFLLHAYQKKFLSIRGLEGDPELEAVFRADLASAICKVFKGNKPTACCCISSNGNNAEATLVLHSPEGHLQIRAAADSVYAATTQLLEKVRNYKGEPGLKLSLEGLLPRCHGCATRKAHRLVNRNYPELNPLSQTSRWKYFVVRLKALFS